MAKTKTNLAAAKRAKNDEFYTQYADVEREVLSYVDYDPDVFRGKAVLLPCDDPEWSNFTRFFAQKFTELGLVKIIGTSYNKDGGPGKLFTLTTEDTNNDGRIDLDDVQWTYLDGDGDFRSDEVRALRDECDVIVTNPPFSLFREFLAWLREDETKQYLVVGNPNAITYKEVFPLIKADQMWWGVKSSGGTNMFLGVPDWYAENLVATKPEGSYWRRVDGRVLAGIKTVWFTNLDHGKRHEHLQLMTVAENLRFNKVFVNKTAYDRYTNYDAIDVPQVKAIPSDYDGVMGVPITFLDKYNPEQFEIVKFRHGDDAKDLAIMRDGTLHTPYFRILIQHRKAPQ